METEMTEHYGKVTNGVQRSEVDTRSGQEFETGAMLWTDQLEVAAIEREQARDVHAFGHRCDERVDEIKVGVSILSEDF